MSVGMQARGSVRFDLARLALAGALATPGVVRAEAGRTGLWVTEERGDRLEGVTVAALAGGRYEVVLHLVTSMTPLVPLTEQVRARVVRAVARAGLPDALGPVHVAIEDTVELEGSA